MSPRQIGAYFHFAVRNKHRELGINLNMYAIAAQAEGKAINEAVNKLMKES
jgi:hypothetical protein